MLLELIQTPLCLFETFDYFEIVINRPPSLHQTFEPSYYIQRDHSTPITIHCKAQNGNITYQWRKDDVAVRNSRQVAVDSKLGTIVFTRIDMSDYGTYQCFASNQYGTALSPPIEVHEARLGSFPADPVSQECTKFQHCLIQCRNRPVCEPESQCRVEWKKGPGTDNNVRVSERVAVDGKDSSQSRIEPLGVYSENTKAFLGQTAELQCIFSGSPIPTIQWKTPELEFIDISNTKKYELADFGRKLLVKNLTINDEGSYTCIANNKVQQQAFLNVTSPPFINPLNKNPQMADTYISAGKNAVFYCDTVSVQGEKPPSPPIWKKNGKDIGANRGVEYSVSADMRELTVLDTEKPSSSRAGSTGSYQCVSSNSEGMIFKDAFLAVLDPIKILIRPENSYLIDRESVISLAVDASTDPALSLQYRWRFRNSNNQTTVLTSNTNPRAWTLSDSNRNLTINAQGLNKDEFFQLIGRYFVEIYHQYDAEFVHIDVVTDIPAIPQEPPAEANLWFLGIIFGVILLIIVIILICCVLYRNACKSGTYPVDEKEVAAGHDPEKELADSGFHDLSRADEDGHKMDNISLSDDFGKQIESDEDSMGEYGGDLDISKFNEDGSFIGIYADKVTNNSKQSTV
uniref:Neuroglian n=1 Tax=Magallana gigas TaxID=29159 RepID=K1Q2R6_MAGGI